jgi:predicted dehydrogenase
MVDIVYIGNTNQLHFKTALMMIEAGKHVLVEKVGALSI